MNMHQNPNFDMKNPRQYPIYDNAPIPKGNVSTGQRIAQCFTTKVIFWAALATFVTWAFFVNPRILSTGNNLMGDRLLFVGGLILGVCEGVMQQKRRATNPAPIWLRIVLGIAILVASFIAAYFLGNNIFFFSLCEGVVAGSGTWYAIAAYRSNWTTYS